MPKAVEILFRNESLLAVNKPAGILSVPDRYNPDRPSLANYLLSSFPEARPLHRLDMDTSGVLLLCLQPEAFGWYSDQFEARTISKKYIAICEGRLMETSGQIDVPLLTTESGKVIVNRKGKESRTDWHLLESFTHHSLVELHPRTGRTHQLRVHLSCLNHPIVGDTAYGASGPLFLSAIKGKKYKPGKDEEFERPIISRVALHADAISIITPEMQEMVTIECPWPKDFKAAVHQLRNWSPVT